MLIVALLSPRGESVNNGISQELRFLSYVLVFDAVNLILELGQEINPVQVDPEDCSGSPP